MAALTRRTPLRRTAMPRVAPKLRRHPKPDPVTPEVREFVLRRDGACLMAVYEPRHVCRDQWGRTHAPWATALLSLEHVKDELRMGVRAPSDPAHLVALCHGANVAVPCKEARVFFREYLERLEAPR